ncbi:hypothetical protein ACWDUK_30555 [Streptomyces cellulosae]
MATDEDGRPYANGFALAVYDWDGWTCEDDCTVCATGVDCADCRACTDFAFPYPPHWARTWQEGEPERGIEAFGGPGGMATGRELVDDGGDWVLIEQNRDAAATARAAGHWVVQADIRTLDLRHPALRCTHRFHGSPPCQTLSDGGKRSAWNSQEISELQRITWQASEAFGFLEVDDLCSLYGGPHHYGDVIDAMEDHPGAYGWGELCGGGHLPPCITPAAFREWAASAVPTSAPRSCRRCSSGSCAWCGSAPPGLHHDGAVGEPAQADPRLGGGHPVRDHQRRGLRLGMVLVADRGRRRLWCLHPPRTGLDGRHPLRAAPLR